MQITHIMRGRGAASAMTTDALVTGLPPVAAVDGSGQAERSPLTGARVKCAPTAAAGLTRPPPRSGTQHTVHSVCTAHLDSTWTCTVRWSSCCRLLLASKIGVV